MFSELNHCGIGKARVTATDAGVKVESESGSGQDGVLIHTGLATNWTAATFSQSDRAENRMLFSSVSEGSVTSTATIDSNGQENTYAARFTGAGESTTYSAMVYHQGRLQAAIGGIRNGTIGVYEPGPYNPGPVTNNPPNCRSRYQSVSACLTQCSQMGYWNCNYCYIPCASTFHVTPRASCEWRFQVASPVVRLSDGREVAADEIVLSEEVRGPTSYPYLGFDEIHIQSTARTVEIVSESVVPAATK
ncbi:hypothetical protein [Myxococcus sp. Y35]|uniref:hypothetical protein n=1 Tax=Pseudomyxococcus flavus TaxID=3115648 RepID=UPI003CEB7E85